MKIINKQSILKSESSCIYDNKLKLKKITKWFNFVLWMAELHISTFKVKYLMNRHMHQIKLK